QNHHDNGNRDRRNGYHISPGREVSGRELLGRRAIPEISHNDHDTACRNQYDSHQTTFKESEFDGKESECGSFNSGSQPGEEGLFIGEMCGDVRVFWIHKEEFPTNFDHIRLKRFTIWPSNAYKIVSKADNVRRVQMLKFVFLLIKPSAMSSITLGGNPANTIGSLPSIGSQAPDFKLIDTNLQPV